jgi:predicted porin
MKKSLIATAVAAGMLASGAAQAEPTVYGILHLSIDTYADNHYFDADKDAPGFQVPDTATKTSDLNMRSHTSAIGIKGSEDLGNGLKAIYKAEFQVTPDQQSGLSDRDQWIGLKGGWGKVAFGTMSTNYKQMGGKIDPLYRTEAEGRGILNMQSGSGFHGGSGPTGGRQNNTVQYTTPKMAGIEVVVNTTVSGGCEGVDAVAGETCDEAIGAGIRWSNKSILLFADYFDPTPLGKGPADSTTYVAADESVMKVGGKFSTKVFQVSGQYEMTEDQLGGDYIFLNGLFNINANNAVTASWGQQDKISDAFAVAYVHMLSKQTNVYAGYGSVSADSCGTAPGSCTYELGVDENGQVQDKGSVFTFGMRKSF